MIVALNAKHEKSFSSRYPLLSKSVTETLVNIMKINRHYLLCNNFLQIGGLSSSRQ